MKILLTAPPRTGKSTIIEKFIKQYKGKKVGIIAKEIRNSENERVGFKSVDMQGNERLCLHVNLIDSEIMVGNKYKVDVNAIDEFVVPQITQKVEPDTVIIIDEIGRAQSCSVKFLKAVETLLDSDSNLLCTILYDDEEWARKFKEHPNSIILEVTEQNRDIMPEVLVLIFSNQRYFNGLDKNKRDFVIEEIKISLRNNDLSRIRSLFYKLFRN